MNQKYTTGVILGSGLKKIIDQMTIHKEVAISELMNTQLMTAGHSGQLFLEKLVVKILSVAKVDLIGMRGEKVRTSLILSRC